MYCLYDICTQWMYVRIKIKYGEKFLEISGGPCILVLSVLSQIDLHPEEIINKINQQQYF